MNLISVAALLALGASFNATAAPCGELLNVTMNKLRGNERVDFCRAFSGKAILAVNTASNCGYTPQFKGLEALYQKYKDQGLVVIGFPSNDFNQEFADPDRTAKVCYQNYGVSFPMMEKSVVKGEAANPFFQRLIKMTGQAPQWNFHKYLIDAQGEKVMAFASSVTPEQLEGRVTELLTHK